MSICYRYKLPFQLQYPYIFLLGIHKGGFQEESIKLVDSVQHLQTVNEREKKLSQITSTQVACEDSRPSSLPAARRERPYNSGQER